MGAGLGGERKSSREDNKKEGRKKGGREIGGVEWDAILSYLWECNGSSARRRRIGGKREEEG